MTAILKGIAILIIVGVMGYMAYEIYNGIEQFNVQVHEFGSGFEGLDGNR